MRASRWSFALCITSGALLFAMATALWPTRAFADDWTDVTQTSYWCLSYANFSDFNGSDISISPSDAQDARLDQLLTGSGAYAYPSGLSNGKTCYVVATISSGALTTGAQFRIAPVFDYLLRTNDYVNNGENVLLTPTSYKYFGRRSNGTWVELTSTDGMFTATYPFTFICAACNARGSAGANGYAKVFGFGVSCKVYVPTRQPDVVNAIDTQTDEINDQSAQNTVEILAGQEEQTEALKDTTGSNTVASDKANVGNQTMQSISFMNVLENVSNSWRGAVSTTESDSQFTFPGMQMMGFAVPSYTVDIWSLIPSLETPCKTCTTFLIIVMCLKYLYALVSVIFGLQDAELAASMAANGIPMEVDEVGTDATGGDRWDSPKYARPRSRNYWRRH